jgi:ankyrin repeat protein
MADFKKQKGLIDEFRATVQDHQPIEFIRAILDRGLDLASLIGADLPLHMAIYNRYCELIPLLLEKGARVDASERTSKCTALHRALMYGHIHAAKLLIDAGSDVNACMHNGSSPLSTLVCWNSHRLSEPFDIVETLLDKQADINSRDDDGNTVLHIAACLDNTELTRLLLRREVNITIRNRRGCTAAEVAGLATRADTALFVELQG